jgi:hypothetical protein
MDRMIEGQGGGDGKGAKNGKVIKERSGLRQMVLGGGYTAKRGDGWLSGGWCWLSGGWMARGTMGG